MCKRIHHGETIYNRADMTEKDLDDFFESMNQEQFDKLMNFLKLCLD